MGNTESRNMGDRLRIETRIERQACVNSLKSFLSPYSSLPCKAAEELGAAIFIHPWDMQLGGRMKKYWLPWLVGMPGETAAAMCSMIFGGVLERFPRLKVCFAHGGEDREGRR